MEGITKHRLEAFSDGVMAIIITVMVFDLKVEYTQDSGSILKSLTKLLPNLISYTVSFLMLAIMWVNHHQLFNEIKKVNAKLLWFNIHLLFWMSLVPFGTHLAGTATMQAEAAALYAGIFLFNAIAFTCIRWYTLKSDLHKDPLAYAIHQAAKRKNRLAIIFYGLAVALAFIHPFISYFIAAAIPLSYFFSNYSKLILKH